MNVGLCGTVMWVTHRGAEIPSTTYILFHNNGNTVAGRESGSCEMFTSNAMQFLYMMIGN